MMPSHSTLVTIIFYILGISIMLPWNFFITANLFWQFKLRNATDLSADFRLHGTKLQVSFMPTLVIISNVFVFAFSFVNLAAALRVNEKTRILGSLGLCFLSMLTITVMAILDTDNWQPSFFGLTMTSVALLNIGIAILQGSIYGLVGSFPSGCVSSVVSGQALAGVFASLAMIVSLAIGNEEPVKSGIIYFVVADLFLLLAIGSYIYLRKMNDYSVAKQKDDEIQTKPRNWDDYLRILNKIKWMGMTLALCLAITLSVYPAVTSYITSTAHPSTWTSVYFQPCITFLLFNIMDMLGRESSRWLQWPSHNGVLFHILANLRVLFVVLLLLCNGDQKSFVTIFYHDAYYIFFYMLFAFTNGYFGSLTLVYYPRLLDDHEVEIGGTLMAGLMGIGLAIGALLSPLFVYIWGPV